MSKQSDSGRGFVKNLPVHLCTRFVFQSDLLKHPHLKQLAIALILRAARKARVVIHAIAVLDDHLHLIVHQGRVRQRHRRTRGIWPFMRNWKSDLSRRLRVLDLTGCKFEARYLSTLLTSYEQYLGKYAYVLDQAVRHRARPEDIVVSDAILVGDVDGLAAVVPDFYPVASSTTPAERARIFGVVMQQIIQAASEIAAGVPFEQSENRDPVREARRAARVDLEARREAYTRRVALMADVDRAELLPSHWYDAAREVLASHRIDGTQASTDMPMLPASRIDERAWRARTNAARTFAIPEIAIEHVPCPINPNRATATKVIAGGRTTLINWSHRIHIDPGS